MEVLICRDPNNGNSTSNRVSANNTYNSSYLLRPIPGLPNRSDFCGKGPDADLFALQGPEITKKVRISELGYELSGFAVKIDVNYWWLVTFLHLIYPIGLSVVWRQS